MHGRLHEVAARRYEKVLVARVASGAGQRPLRAPDQGGGGCILMQDGLQQAEAGRSGSALGDVSAWSYFTKATTSEGLVMNGTSNTRRNGTEATSHNRRVRRPLSLFGGILLACAATFGSVAGTVSFMPTLAGGAVSVTADSATTPGQPCTGAWD
jgi:hypothetical protein